MISLKNILNSGKLIIVQFWASNSTQVDKYQGELLNIYNRYHNKGLNIVGISSDTVANKWKGAIVRNDLPWLQVSDLKGKNGVVHTIYKEFGVDARIPNTTNVVIDPDGKIVAWDISGPELEYLLYQKFDK